MIDAHDDAVSYAKLWPVLQFHPGPSRVAILVETRHLAFYYDGCAVDTGGRYEYVNLFPILKRQLTGPNNRRYAHIASGGNQTALGAPHLNIVMDARKLVSIRYQLSRSR